jgi:copper chaperone CopZ
MCAMTTFAVTGMTCNNCLKKVEATLKSLAPDVKVTLTPPRAVTASPVSAEKLNEALAGVGQYRVSADIAIEASPSWFATYYPLFLVLGLIALVSFASESWMMAFMAGFYIVFGAFKLLDISAFANAYARYDVIAERVKAWGYVYPFVEVAMGFAFLFWWEMRAMAWLALVLSLIGAVGVIRATRSKQIIQCACLGTVFKLPMSVVTIVENLGMATMAAWMLFVGM